MRRVVAATALSAAVIPATFADDGGISFGGNPHLLKGHASVEMRGETVHLNVGDKVIKVDCLFHFHNNGPTCTVCMGFPDHGLGAQEPFQGEPLPTGSKLHATFITYDSYVDGKKVPTKLVPTNDRGLFWHTKTVTFKGNSDCTIRDVYTLPPGQQLTSENGGYFQTYYILHTGSSWHGPIGSCEVVIDFAPNVLPTPVVLKAIKSLPDDNLEKLKWSQLPKGIVIWQGPCQPKVVGRQLKFVRQKFEPPESDDIQMYYGFKLLTNMQ
jgi:hypothetical protein